MTSSDPVIEFVVRREGRWFSAPVPVADPVEVSLADVRAAVTGCAVSPVVLRSGPAAAGRPVLTPGPLDVVAPVWALVGVVTPWGVVLEDRDGAHVVLDDVDLTVLDALVGPTTVGDLDCGVEPELLAERLGRLVAAGRARLVEPDPTGDTNEPAGAATEPAAVTPAPGAGAGAGARLVAALRASRIADMARRSSKVTTVRRRLGLLPAMAPTPEPAAVPEATPDPPADVPEAPAAPVDAWAGDDGPEGRIPVYAIWHPHVGPLLSLGMLTAAARNWNDGALTDRYEIRRPETAESFLDDLATRQGPAVLLCSDYVWSLDENLDAARAGLATNADLVVLHGGPSCPKYEGDAEAFLDTHGDIAHVLTRGEGEHLLCELLDALTDTLTEPGAHPLGTQTLAAIDGITYRDPATGATVRTPERDRITDLDELPSPYLTGEFDHIPASAWNYGLSVETNRGCPYGCTFCDWGSSTLSRIRKFDLERVTAEIRWAAERHMFSLMVTDANFGIMSRDVETARRIADIRRDTDHPPFVSITPAKNTTKHLVKITDTFLSAGIVPTMSLSLQSTDPTTLDAIDRNNISTEHYVQLAREFRVRGLPLQSDILVGLPGQTYDSYREDLQFMIDQEILVRTWPVQVLPNAPMNDPEYRERFDIRVNEQHTVVSTSTFSPADRDRMFRLRRLYVSGEAFGVLRHVMRWLQWDHHIPATDLMDHILHVTHTTPHRYPHLTWLVEYFDLHPTVPVGWATLYDEIRHLLTTDYDIDPHDTALDTVLTLQQFLMPQPGRTFPATITLAHDYPTYYRDATHTLYTTGHATTPDHPLHTHPPTTFTITDDPLGLCTWGILFGGDSRDELMEGDFLIGSNSAHELISPLTRHSPFLESLGIDAPQREGTESYLDDPEAQDEGDAEIGGPATGGTGAVAVQLRRRD